MSSQDDKPTSGSIEARSKSGEGSCGQETSIVHEALPNDPPNQPSCNPTGPHTGAPLAQRESLASTFDSIEAAARQSRVAASELISLTLLSGIMAANRTATVSSHPLPGYLFSSNTQNLDLLSSISSAMQPSPNENGGAASTVNSFAQQPATHSSLTTPCLLTGGAIQAPPPATHGLAQGLSSLLSPPVAMQRTVQPYLMRQMTLPAPTLPSRFQLADPAAAVYHAIKEKNPQSAAAPRRWTKREMFPERLFRLLEEMDSAGRGDIISFVEDGTKVKIHRPEVFERDVIPRYFNQQGLGSFKKQLSLYGFTRHESKKNGLVSSLAFRHPKFRRDSPHLCFEMDRNRHNTKSSKPKKDGK